MDEECKEYFPEDEAKEIEFPESDPNGDRGDELENFKRFLMFPDEDTEKCIRCKESIVSWSGKSLFCMKNGIIVKSL